MITRFAHRVAAKSSFPHASSGNPGYGLFLLLLFFCFTAGIAWSQTKAVAIVGGTLIDGTGRAPLEDAAVVILNGRIQAVGKRGDVGDSARRRSDRCQGQKHSPRFDRRPLSLPRLDGRSLSRLRRRHLPEYFQQSRRMDHRAARGREKRQCARSARVGFREHHRRAAARGHRHACGASAPASSSTAKTKRAKRFVIWSRKASTASNSSSG